MSPLKARIRAAYQAKPWKTTQELARQFKCHDDTVSLAIRDIRVDNAQSTQPSKKGRRFVPLPDVL